MNTLQALTEPADRVACLSAAREHLAPGGELIFDVALPDAEEIVATMGVERPGGLHHDPGSGAMLEHSAWYDRWEPDTHTLEFTLRMEQRGAPARRAPCCAGTACTCSPRRRSACCWTGRGSSRSRCSATSTAPR